MRESDGRADYELSVYGSYRDAMTGQPAALSFQTPLSPDEVRALMNGDVVERPDPQTYGAVNYYAPGGTDPTRATATRWMRSLTAQWNADATVTVRATLGPVVRFEDGTARPSTPTAVVELRGRPRVTCTHEGSTPNNPVDDPRFESTFCRAALAGTGLSRVVALAE